VGHRGDRLRRPELSSQATVLVASPAFDLSLRLFPKGKQRTALLVKLKEIFRASRSQPVGGVIKKINPILRGWVKYFAIGHSSRCFSYLNPA
jgi:hypothetical protein